MILTFLHIQNKLTQEFQNLWNMIGRIKLFELNHNSWRVQYFKKPSGPDLRKQCKEPAQQRQYNPIKEFTNKIKNFPKKALHRIC